MLCFAPLKINALCVPVFAFQIQVEMILEQDETDYHTVMFEIQSAYLVHWI